ncbi:MAG: ester cyclase [Vicinamibacterales bacterium]
MTSEEVQGFLNRFRTAWQEQDLEALSDCYTDNCEVVSPIYHTVRGRAALENSFRDAFRAFSAISVKSDDAIIDSEHGRAAVIWTLTSKHQGEIFGVPASGKTIEVTIAFVLTFEGGRIAKEVRIYDFAKMLLHLGVLRAKA